MVASYDEFLPTSSLGNGPQGKSVERTIQVYAATEIDAEASGLVPQRGNSITDGSGQPLYCNNVSVKSIPDGVSAAGLLLFEVTATYQPLDKSPTEGKARWTVNGRSDQVKRFAVNGAAYKQDYPLEDGGSAMAGVDVYDGLGINVTENGNEGVDVDDPYEVLTIDMWVAPEDTAALLAKIRALRNCVNQDEFAGPWGSYAAGEARLHDYTVSHVNGELDQVSIEFLVRNNVEFDATAQGQTFTVSKGGHDYYWQRMIKKSSATDEKKNQVEIQDVHVDKVYKDGDFSTLGITYDLFDATEPS